MKPLAIIAATSLAALASGFAVAQPKPIPPVGGDGPRHERSEARNDEGRAEGRERRAQRMQERLDERFAKLRADMKLKPEQVPLFDAVEGLVKKRSAERREAWAALRERRETFRHADMMERLDMRASSLTERATHAKELADAVRPLWATLSDEQKTVARRAVREAMAEGRERMRSMRENWREHHGDRDDDERGPRRWREDGRERRG